MPLATTPKVDYVIVVDDIPDNLFLIQTTLEDQGYRIELFSDGLSALAAIEKTPPDLVLLDVMMPVIDGYEVTRRIRQNKYLPYIPILLITAHDQPSVVKGLDAGADDFIRKPFDMNELLARVRSLLRLKHSIDQQQEMMQQREDFVSRLTHDLRTPLVAADRMLQLFIEETFCPISVEMRDAIQAMMRSNQNLLKMTNTLLEVYRHEAGQKQLNFASCNIARMIQEIVQELELLATEKDLSLETQFESADGDGARAWVMTGDGMELRRVFMNLIGNAIKFTDQGSITIRVTPLMLPAHPNDGEGERMLKEKRTPAAKRWLAIEVQDTGAGIAPDEQEKLFERFRQGKHKKADSGLGLYLSRCIVEAHGGTITVTSEVAKGSTFTVYLPVQASQTRPTIHSSSAYRL